MKIPPYWAKTSARAAGSGGRNLAIACWRWSDVSVEDAQRQADARAVELDRLFQAGNPLDRYSYGNGALREEIVQKVPTEAGPESAIVTRNLYGALVLNTASAMFIDVDFPNGGKSAGRGGIFRGLWGKPAAPSPEDRALQQFRDWAAQYPELGLRIYRTAAGLRGLVTNRTFDPADSRTLDLLRAVGSDPLYIRLCQSQACFRARLTPKPWRCGLFNPPARFPWESANEEAQFRKWQADYERSIHEYSVCRFVQQIGRTESDPEIQPIIALHDQFACKEGELPLA